MTPTTLKDDLLDGADEIAAFCGFPIRRTYSLLESGALPAFKLRRRWYCRKSKLVAHIEKLENDS